MRFLPIVAAVSIGLAGCSAGRDKAAAEAGVETFRQALAAGRYAEIYRNAGPEFRQSGTEESAAGFLGSVHQRLGNVRTANQTGWRVNYQPGDSRAVLNYSTEFERGRGTEEFVFRISEGESILIGYHIDSNELRSTVTPAGPPSDGKPQ
jgi:hypothetical protein